MNGLNFSAGGTRWRVIVVTDELRKREHLPPLPGTGLLFTADDGSSRFMPLDDDALPTLEELQAKSNQELAALAELAGAWPGKSRR